MILTNCAACAAPLANSAPKCVRCQTRGVPSLSDLNEAVALLEEVDRTCEELYDKSHGDSQVVKAEL